MRVRRASLKSMAALALVLMLAPFLLPAPTTAAAPTQAQEGGQVNEVTLYMSDITLTSQEVFTPTNFAYNGEVTLARLTTTLPGPGEPIAIPCESLWYTKKPSGSPDLIYGNYESVGKWETGPLHNDVVIDGPFYSRIWVKGTARDAGFLFMVDRISPDNMYSRIGEVRTEFRDIEAVSYQLFEPETDLLLKGVNIEKGGRIRVSVGFTGRIPPDSELNLLYGTSDYDSLARFSMNSVSISNSVKIDRQDRIASIQVNATNALGLGDMQSITLTVTKKDEIFFEKNLNHTEIQMLGNQTNATVGSLWRWKYSTEHEGTEYSATVVVIDNSSQKWNRTVTFYIEPTLVTMTWQLAALMIFVALAGGAGGTVVYRRIRYGYVITDVFLIHLDTGLLVSYISTSKGEGKGDEDIVSGMLTALQDYAKGTGAKSVGEVDLERITSAARSQETEKHKQTADRISVLVAASGEFVKNAFKRDTLTEGGDSESIDQMKLGDLLVLVERGKLSYMATVISGYEHDALRRRMKRAVQAIEQDYGDVLAGWKGSMKDVVLVRNYLEEFLKAGFIRKLFGQA